MSEDSAALDSLLLDGIRRGDQRALSALYDRYARIGLALAYRIVSDREAAEEVLQEAFMAVWRRAATYKDSAGSVRNWFLSIVHHRAIDRLRSRRHDGNRVPLDDRWAVGDRTGILPIVTALIERSQLISALAQLAAEQREALELAYFSGYSCREISEMTGTPVGTVKSRMRLGLQHLRHALHPLMAETEGV